MPVWKSILNIFTACSEFVLGMSWITVQCVQKLNILQSCRSYTAKQWIHRYYRDSILIFKLLNDVTFHTQMSIQRIWELNTHPVERRGEKRRWVIRTLRMKGSVSTFSFFRLAFKAAVCQAFCWGKAAAWDHLPNVPPSCSGSFIWLNISLPYHQNSKSWLSYTLSLFYTLHELFYFKCKLPN